MPTQPHEHPMDQIVRLMEKFAAPSQTDGLSNRARLDLPAVQVSLRTAEMASRVEAGARIAGRR